MMNKSCYCKRLYSLLILRLTQLIAIAGLTLVSGCLSNDSKVELFIPGHARPIQLLIEGQVVAKLDSVDKGTSITLTTNQTAIVDRMKDRYKDTNPCDVSLDSRIVPADDPSFSLQILTPDGWAKYPVCLQNYQNKYRVEASMIKALNVTLFLDNRGCPKSELNYGQMKIILAENEATQLSVPAARLAENMGVSLNGKRVGSIDISPLSVGNYLIDCSGKRSYHWRTVSYGSLITTSEPDQFMSGKFLHRVWGGKVEYFIKPAPERIRTTGISALSSELVEVTAK
jgi:hypothetical protein